MLLPDCFGCVQFNWEGRGNLSAFIDLAAKSNLFVNLRIGPYVVRARQVQQAGLWVSGCCVAASSAWLAVTRTPSVVRD